MFKKWRLLGVPLVLAMVVVGLMAWRGCRREDSRPPATAGDFPVNEITLTSPDLDLDLAAVRTTDHPGYTDWTLLFECREREGCMADVRVRVLYRASGERRTLQMGGRLDSARGETARLGRVLRPPVTVERIDEVIVEVAAPYSRDAPRPTPVQ